MMKMIKLNSAAKILIICMGVLIMLTGCRADPLPPLEGRTNLALGQKVLFAPKPNYASTAKGDTDATDLTDGKISHKNEMWTDPLAVGWIYPGRINIAVDLGKECDIDEISIRLEQRWLSLNVPGWMEALVSDDGIHYTKVAERSRWNNKDKDFYQGESSITNNGDLSAYSWRFSDLKGVRGRYVGLRISANKLLVADELYVFGKASDTAESSSKGSPSGFSVTVPQPYFNKPELVIPTNITAPQPMGLVTGNSTTAKGKLEIEFDLPPGLTIDAPLQDMQKSTLPDDWTRYRFSQVNPKASTSFARLYLRAPNGKDNQTGDIHWRYSFGKWQSSELTMPYRTVSVPMTAAPRRLDTIGFGCWTIGNTLSWPDALNTFKHVGLNAISLYATSGSPAWLPQDKHAPEWKLLKDARHQGFKVFGMDPLYMTMWKKNRNHSDGQEMFCHYADGTISKWICPSYRGKYYQEEIERFANQIAAVQPDFTMQDIELWGGGAGGSKAVKNCPQCVADFKASGLKTWDEWWQAKGSQMWIDAINAARQKLKEEGGKQNFLTSGYFFEAGKTYQGAFNFDKLYPQYIQIANPRHYSSSYPRDILHIAEMVRENRQKLPHSDVWELLSPGDSGPIPGDAFKWSILESYCNGARGVMFWSSRYLDAEDIIAYSDAIRAITPMEDIIMDGQLIDDTAQVETPGHLSGMKNDNKMVLLVSDYQHTGNGTLQLKLQLKVPSQIRDLSSGKILEANLPAGSKEIPIPLNGADARLLEVSPL